MNDRGLFSAYYRNNTSAIVVETGDGSEWVTISHAWPNVDWEFTLRSRQELDDLYYMLGRVIHEADIQSD